MRFVCFFSVQVKHRVLVYTPSLRWNETHCSRAMGQGSHVRRSPSLPDYFWRTYRSSPLTAAANWREYTRIQRAHSRVIDPRLKFIWPSAGCANPCGMPLPDKPELLDLLRNLLLLFFLFFFPSSLVPLFSTLPTCKKIKVRSPKNDFAYVMEKIDSRRCRVIIRNGKTAFFKLFNYEIFNSFKHVYEQISEFSAYLIIRV